MQKRASVACGCATQVHAQHGSDVASGRDCSCGRHGCGQLTHHLRWPARPNTAWECVAVLEGVLECVVALGVLGQFQHPCCRAWLPALLTRMAGRSLPAREAASTGPASHRVCINGQPGLMGSACTCTQKYIHKQTHARSSRCTARAGGAHLAVHQRLGRPVPPSRRASRAIRRVCARAPGHRGSLVAMPAAHKVAAKGARLRGRFVGGKGSARAARCPPAPCCGSINGGPSAEGAALLMVGKGQADAAGHWRAVGVGCTRVRMCGVCWVQWEVGGCGMNARRRQQQQQQQQLERQGCAGRAYTTRCHCPTSECAQMLGHAHERCLPPCVIRDHMAMLRALSQRWCTTSGRGAAAPTVRRFLSPVSPAAGLVTSQHSKAPHTSLNVAYQRRHWAPHLSVPVDGGPPSPAGTCQHLSAIPREPPSPVSGLLPADMRASKLACSAVGWALLGLRGRPGDSGRAGTASGRLCRVSRYSELGRFRCVSDQSNLGPAGQAASGTQAGGCVRRRVRVHVRALEPNP